MVDSPGVPILTPPTTGGAPEAAIEEFLTAADQPTQEDPPVQVFRNGRWIVVSS